MKNDTICHEIPLTIIERETPLAEIVTEWLCTRGTLIAFASMVVAAVHGMGR